MPPVIDRTKCIGCGMCADVCPLQVFRHDPKKDKIPEVRRPYECWHCNACVLDCSASPPARARVPTQYFGWM